ncbi:hypothetical protein GCM10022631_29560 [Deinococcus rubellus]|uniref:Uncharacterized protein n=1 Tax=Deinococcus rubellus TaxID=1889240 RepID=A0ABY5YHD4_9DEIO|nr:hypothetical protein [Deinococcus rubellus]UWX64198.1 hypothetical protein N0D28_00515 [Deinococcus rubellus]
MTVLWRDRWDDTPQVVVFAYDDVQDGVLVDAVLMINSELPGLPVTLTDPFGASFTLRLPETYLTVETPLVVVGVDLELEPSKSMTHD